MFRGRKENNFKDQRLRIRKSGHLLLEAAGSSVSLACVCVWGVGGEVRSD